MTCQRPTEHSARFRRDRRPSPRPRPRPKHRLPAIPEEKLEVKLEITPGTPATAEEAKFRSTLLFRVTSCHVHSEFSPS